MATATKALARASSSCSCSPRSPPHPPSPISRRMLSCRHIHVSKAPELICAPFKSTAPIWHLPDERLLFSAQQDLEDMFTELEAEGGYDINFKDGLGNTALHYAVMHLSPRVLELILEHEGADVDLLNHQGLAPLHCAMQIAQPLPRVEIAKLLLEAGADPRTKNSRSQKPIDMLPPPSPSDVSEDVDLRERLKEAEAELIDAEDVAIDEYKYDADDVASDESG